MHWKQYTVHNQLRVPGINNTGVYTYCMNLEIELCTHMHTTQIIL
jgi:hypothetical protein